MQSERNTPFRTSTDVKLCDYHFQVKSFQQPLETLNVKWRRRRKKKKKKKKKKKESTSE
jgi:hypothetical protein